jgi:hypothetical protein
MFCCIPFGLAALLMFRFVHIVFGKREAVLSAASRLRKNPAVVTERPFGAEPGARRGRPANMNASQAVLSCCKIGVIR